MAARRRTDAAAQLLAGPLLSKQGQVVRALAAELLARQADERRVQEYGAQIGASTGTVQSALDYLQSAGGVRLEARGRLGTFARELHYPILWALAEGRPLVGSMPLPYSRRFEGLATGIRLQFGRQPLNLDLRFSRGSTARLQALAARECDWILISRYAAETAHVLGFAIETVFALGANTYMADSALLIGRTNALGLSDRMRIGIDLQSTDHAYTVRSVCKGRQVSFVEIEYSQGLKLISSGQIDATVWSIEDIPTELEGLSAIPLEQLAGLEIARLREAAIVVAEGNAAVRNVLRAAIDPFELTETQREVVAFTRLPMY
jgi:DNA-binding CsgD family transcriptional regulator